MTWAIGRKALVIAYMACVVACLGAQDAVRPVSAASDASQAAAKAGAPVAVAQAPTPVQVWVTKSRPAPGRVVYRYNVRNGTAYLITGVEVGFDRSLGVPELRRGPIGWDGEKVRASSRTSPPGWDFAVITTEEDSLVNIEWSAPDSAIAGGATQSGFSVTIAEEDSLYERGHWSAIMGTGPQTRCSGALRPRVTLSK